MYYSSQDENIRYTGRWGTIGDRQTATATGSYFEFAFTGTMAVMHFNMQNASVPYPHIWISMDGGSRFESTLAPYLRIQAETPGVHSVRVIYKSAVEVQHRWYQPLCGKIDFCGITADGLAPLQADNRKTIEFVGDSITEGVLVDDISHVLQPEYLNRPFQDDVCATYAWLTAEKLNLRPYFMGYGAVGVTRAGNASVPRAALAYPFNFHESPVAYGDPDYILINHGANDRGCSETEYIACYRELLDTICSLRSHSKIIMLSAFCGVYPAALQELSADYNREHKTDIVFIDSAGWVPKEPLHPLRAGHKIIADRLTDALQNLL